MAPDVPSVRTQFTPAMVPGWSTLPTFSATLMISYPEGGVVSVDHAACTARVQYAHELATGDIPWLASRAEFTCTWPPPAIGEQVMALAPEADTGRGAIIGGRSSNAHAYPANDASSVTEYNDSARNDYDPATHAHATILPSGTRVRSDTNGGLSFNGDFTIDGDITSTGTITAETDVVGGGKSLKNLVDVHVGIQVGGRSRVSLNDRHGRPIR